jgi:single-stranded-DNA-specific exonuclease
MQSEDIKSIIKEYYYRFFSEQENNNTYNSTIFQLNNDDYIDKLPYINGIYNFSLRIILAVIRKEKIIIYADYDADAVTSTATLYYALINLGVHKDNITYYAPDRFTENYGVNSQAVHKLSKDNDLIITVDTGITAVEELNIAKQYHTDVLITDHHLLKSELPNVAAIINPQLNAKYNTVATESYLGSINESLTELLSRFEGDIGEKTKNIYKKFETKLKNNDFEYVSTSTVGAGVVWYAMLYTHYIMREFGFDVNARYMANLLQFVAIGTIADCQPMNDTSNRYLTAVGLSNINTHFTLFPGLCALIESTGLMSKITNGGKIDSQDIAFTIAPALNAPGRIAHASIAINLLCANGDVEDLAMQVAEINKERKDIVKKITSEINSRAAEQIANGSNIIVLEGEWNKGVVGLVASRLTANYNVPSIVISTLKDPYSGSVRAPEGINAVNILDNIKDNLVRYGGHAGAAGLMVESTNLNTIKSILSNHKIKLLKTDKVILPNNVPISLEKIYSQNNTIYLQNGINNNLITSILQLDPFGTLFPFPNFLFESNVSNFSYMSEGKHAKWHINGVDIVIFNISSEQKEKLDSKNVWIYGKPSINYFNGGVYAQIIVEVIL